MADNLQPFLDMAHNSARLVALHSAEVGHLKIATAGTRQDLTEMRIAIADTKKDIMYIKNKARQERH